MEVTVPNDQSPNLLRTIILVAAAADLLIGPALTLKAIPPDFPLWATVTVVLGQVGAVVILALKFRISAVRKI